MKRQAATPKGIQRRVRDLELGRIRDPRQAAKVKYPLSTLLGVLVISMVTMARSLREVEDRSEQIARNRGLWLGINQRIADNTFGKVLPRLKFKALVKRLHAAVKAEKRRGNLEPTQLPFRTAAIDGKNVATLRWFDLCRVLTLDPNEATPSQVKRRLKKEYPNLQFCKPRDGKPYALARVHTVTLISSAAGCCIHQRPIAGATNEIGSMPALLKELRAAYGRTGLVEMLTTDAGNTSLGVATAIVDDLGWDYFCQIKSDNGEVYREADRALGRRRKPAFEYADKQNGNAVTYRVWCHDLGDNGWLEWTHARQLVRVQRIAEHPTTGKKTTGNRYYVTSKTHQELGPENAIAVSRAHWRCEEETHWTADAMLQEDRRQLAWSRHPDGVFIVSLLRMMALNILAVARKLSRVGERHETPRWHQVAQHFLLALCEPALCTEAFDRID